MSALLAALFTTVGEGLKLVNIEKAREFNKKYADTQLLIVAEEAKGDNSDDAKIERLYKELEILVVAARTELELAVRSK